MAATDGSTKGSLPARGTRHGSWPIALAWAGWCWVLTATATTLPEDRADALYHSYEGGGLQVRGPSLLVRKSVGRQASVWANYYVDMVSSASVDVMATASPYTEKRTEWSAGIDYLHDKTTFGLAYTSSEEPDYSAKNVHFGISQDFFGDLTTIGISIGRGWNVVRKHNQAAFREDMDSREYRLDVSQVVTRSLVAGFSYETISDQGFLNNPYRSVRFRDATTPRGFSYQPELYPRTHTSNAVALRAKYFLPYRAALGAEYRWYHDTYGIRSNDVGLDYTHPLGEHWTFDGRLRYYRQSAADFYGDLFAVRNAQNFLARDKELSSFNSQSIGLGVSYDMGRILTPIFSRGTVSVQGDYMRYKYDDFRDGTKGGAPGLEPLYEFDAFVIRAYLSVYL